MSEIETERRIKEMRATLTETDRLIDEIALELMNADDMLGAQARAALRAVLKRYYVVPRGLSGVTHEMEMAGIDDIGRQGIALDEDSPPLFPAETFRAMAEASPISMEPADE